MSSALHTSGVSALVFALYREISASLLMLLLALAAGKQAGHGFHIDRQYWPRLVLMVCVCVCVCVCVLSVCTRLRTML
jgi:hypothetical protein